MNIETVEKAYHLKLIEIWEASVRATHDFLAEDDLQELKPLILEQYFDAVDLMCAKDGHGEIQGFVASMTVILRCCSSHLMRAEKALVQC